MKGGQKKKKEILDEHQQEIDGQYPKMVSGKTEKLQTTVEESTSHEQSTERADSDMQVERHSTIEANSRSTIRIKA